MAISCIIIEDEPLAMERAKEFVAKVPFLTLLQSFDNGLEALAFLKREKVELLFLDIEMDELSGIELLQALTHRPQVILTTAYEQYALKGYELSVVDYLLKPYTFGRFLQAVSKVREELEKRKEYAVHPFIFIKTSYRLEKVYLHEILFIEGMRDYRCIHLPTKKVLTLETFTELQHRLPSSEFCRVHKSFMVAISKIQSIERDRILLEKAQIPISETYKEEFYHLIK
jgi:DNA-binding LytR/AlgR family response regulator